MSDDVNQRLTDAHYGGRSTLPDERRQFLGSLRERTKLGVTLDQLQDTQTLSILQTSLQQTQEPSYHILLNGYLSPSLLSQYMIFLKKLHYQVTVVNNEDTPHEPSSWGLLLVADQAINEPSITLDSLMTTQATPSVNSPKESWTSKLKHWLLE